MLPHCYLKMYTKMLLEDSTSAAKRFHQETAELLLSKGSSLRQQELCSLWPSRAAKFVVCVPTFKFRIVTLCHVSLDVFYPNLFRSSDVVEKAIAILHDQHLANPSTTNRRDLDCC